MYIYLLVRLCRPPVSVHTQDVHNRLPAREERAQVDDEQRHLQENTNQPQYQLFGEKSRYYNLKINRHRADFKDWIFIFIHLEELHQFVACISSIVTKAFCQITMLLP